LAFARVLGTMHLTFVLFAALAAASPGPIADPQPTADLAREARAAYDKGDKATFLAKYEEIARRRPGDVYVLYNLACGQALNGKTAEAQKTLLEIASLRAASDLDGDGDFESIRQTDGYRTASARMQALRTERISSGAVVAFTIPEKGLVPEGVAYDPVTKSFFVSSIRKRKVYRIDSAGKASVFVAPREGGLRTAAGIGIDPKRRSLWVASEAMPHMEGYVKDEPLQAALFEFDADTGKLRREIRPPATGKAAGFDDLAVASDGRVYVNDGFNGRVWTLPPGGSALEVFFVSDVFRGTQGLAPTPDGKTLYVSDYSGLYRVDVASKRIARLAVPAGAALNGVDGLVWSAGSLYAVQNGVEPNRIIRVDLAPDGSTVTGAKILEMNHPSFDEPTLGVVADGALYVSANSQGAKFRNEKQPIAPGAMTEAVVLRVPLAPASR
jgi:sugar lactone lactonase YvrE